MTSTERVIIAENGDVEVRELITDTTPEAPLFPEDKDVANWDSSEAFLDWFGNTASPSVEIGDATIWLYHQAINGGYIRGTRLTGPNGNYFFATGNASYRVVPGRYTHQLDGYIGGNNRAGRIASGIRYKRPR